MPRAFSKRLIIDTCVARASGGVDATHPTSKQCRDFLNVVLNISHRVVMTPEIWAEWRKHQSSFAGRWLVEMRRKGKVIQVSSAIKEDIRQKVGVFAIDNSLNVYEILKDIHLVEAAIVTDRSIVSFEHYARRHYSKAAQVEVPEMRNIVWVNPCAENEQPLVWLRNGAKREEHRQLGVWAESVT